MSTYAQPNRQDGLLDLLEALQSTLVDIYVCQDYNEWLWDEGQSLVERIEVILVERYGASKDSAIRPRRS